MVFQNFQDRINNYINNMAKNYKIIKKNSQKQLIDYFIREFHKINRIKEKKGERLSFVLTGGKSPIKLYRSLSKSKTNWENVDFFWGDERYVSKNSQHSNYKLAKKNILDNLKIDKKQLFSVNTVKPNLISSSKDYEKKIKKYFFRKKLKFDIILLGLGEDGHIASIFPGEIDKNNINVTKSVIRDDFERISLTLKTINNAKKIFLWLPTKKISRIFYDSFNNKKKPVSYINKRKIFVFSVLY